MFINLTSISPIAFELAKVGDVVSIKKKAPNAREFRGSLEKPVDAFLVFKGVTKVGMIPSATSNNIENISQIRRAVIQSMDVSIKQIAIYIDADTL
ncbi:MAG: hypothetical protein K9J38_13900 [Polynucleobacter sp.]|nr:hypothetical protein [Polynucleobacter sp.]